MEINAKIKELLKATSPIATQDVFDFIKGMLGKRRKGKRWDPGNGQRALCNGSMIKSVNNVGQQEKIIMGNRRCGGIGVHVVGSKVQGYYTDIYREGWE
jgi:hypothetical protein